MCCTRAVFFRAIHSCLNSCCVCPLVACMSWAGLQERGYVIILQCGIEYGGTVSSTGRLASNLWSPKSVQRSEQQIYVCVKSIFVKFEANIQVTFTVFRLGLEELHDVVDVLTIQPACQRPLCTSMHTNRSLPGSFSHGASSNHESCWVRCTLGRHPYVSYADV